MKRVVLVVASTLAVAHADTRADEPASGWELYPHGVELQLGIASPIGLGVAADTAPVRWLSVWAGAGLSSGGVQLAAGVRVRAVRGRRHAWYVGAAPSVGRYEEPTPHEDADRVNARAVWANAEAGFEYRQPRGFTFRAFAGATHMLNQGDVVCVGDDAASCRPEELWGDQLPYGGIALGFSL